MPAACQVAVFHCLLVIDLELIQLWGEVEMLWYTMLLWHITLYSHEEHNSNNNKKKKPIFTLTLSQFPAIGARSPSIQCQSISSKFVLTLITYFTGASVQGSLHAAETSIEIVFVNVFPTHRTLCYL